MSLKVLSTLEKNIETKDNNIVWAFKYAHIYYDHSTIKLNLNANYYYKQSLKNEYGWKDSLQVIIGSEEVLDWFDNPIN